MVWTSEGVAGFTVQFRLDDFQVIVGDDDVRVQDNEVVAMAVRGAVVARGTGSGVGFEEVAQCQPVMVFLADSITFFRGTVLHHNDLEVFENLAAEALQKLIDFLGPVVHGYDDGKPHFQTFLQR